MADNTRIDNGTTGDLIATEDIGGVKHELVKLQFGEHGSATDVSATDPLPVGVASLPLPDGASTDAKQDAGNASVASIDSKTPALGQALAAGSVPVVMTAAQLAALAPYATVSISNLPATQPVSAVALPLPSGASTEATLAAIKAKTDNIDVALSTRTKPADTQAVSAASLPLPAGAATAANQTTMDGHLSDGTQQSKLTDGTNIANVLKSDGSAAGQNAQLVAGTYLSVPFSTATAQAVGTTDAGDYKSVSVQTVSQGTSSTITFQGSNDGTNWVSVALLSTGATGTTAPASGTTGSSRIDAGSLPYRYFRLNVTGIRRDYIGHHCLFNSGLFALNGNEQCYIEQCHGRGCTSECVLYGDERWYQSCTTKECWLGW